jgi:BTB/POZ domain
MQVGDVRFSVHKSVLTGYRGFLGALMTTDMVEGRQSEITLTDVNPDLLKMLLDYMYGKVR